MKNNHNKIKILFLSTIAMFLVGAIPVSASTFLTSQETINVKKGDVVKIRVSVDTQNIKNYTFKSSIKFPADLVSVNGWQWNDDWMPLVVVGYDSIDNTKGSIIRTAGYPGGVLGQKEFGVITFIAKKDGKGVITLNGGDSLVLNIDGENTLIK